MDWDDYKFVLAVARGNGLPGAADRLGVTVSTVFRRLEKVEHDLGGPLFIRSRSGYEPNEAGVSVIEHAVRIEAEVQSAERTLNGQDGTLTGRVVLTASEVLGPYFVCRHLPAFHLAHPELTVDVVAGNETMDLASGEADVAFRPIRPTDSNLFGRKISGIRWGVYGRRRRGRTAPRFNDLDTLSKHRFVGFGGDRSARLAMLQQKSRFPDAPVGSRTNSLIASAAIAAAGPDLALLPCLLGEQWPGLTCFAAPMKHQFGEVWMVCHKDVRRNAKIRTVFDFFIAQAAADAALFLGSVGDN